MNRELIKQLHQHVFEVERLLREWLAATDPNFPSLTKLVEDDLADKHEQRIRGTLEGTAKHGRLVDVQIPNKGGKSTKVLITDEHGTSFTAYAGTFAFDPEDLLQYEGYDIYYTVKEIEKGDSRFTALASWQPLT